jgi:hypothetical protein
MKPFKSVLSLSLSVLVSFSVLSVAELKPLNDDGLAAHVGQINQAAVNKDKGFQVPLLLREANSQSPQSSSFNSQSTSNTPSSGITLDIDLQLQIDEIRWVDIDGAGPNGTQGAVVLQGLSIGHLDGPTPEPAQTRGITIDADGRDGLVIGIGQIGDRFGNGIDLNIDSVQIK